MVARITTKLNIEFSDLSPSERSFNVDDMNETLTSVFAVSVVHQRTYLRDRGLMVPNSARAWADRFMSSRDFFPNRRITERNLLLI